MTDYQKSVFSGAAVAVRYAALNPVLAIIPRGAVDRVSSVAHVPVLQTVNGTVIYQIFLEVLRRSRQ